MWETKPYITTYWKICYELLATKVDFHWKNEDKDLNLYFYFLIILRSLPRRRHPSFVALFVAWAMVQRLPLHCSKSPNYLTKSILTCSTLVIEFTAWAMTKRLSFHCSNNNPTIWQSQYWLGQCSSKWWWNKRYKYLAN